MKRNETRCLKCPGFQHSVFYGIADADLPDIPMPELHTTGEILFTENEPSHGAYCICNGHVLISKSDSRKETKRIITVAGPGEFIGVSSVLYTGGYSTTAQCLEKTQVCRFSPSELELLMQKHPRLRMNLMRLLAQKLNQLEAHQGYEEL